MSTEFSKKIYEPGRVEDSTVPYWGGVELEERKRYTVVSEFPYSYSGCNNGCSISNMLSVGVGVKCIRSQSYVNSHDVVYRASM